MPLAAVDVSSLSGAQMSTEAKLPAYNEPSDKWEAIAHSLSDAQQAPSAPEEPVVAVEWPCLRPGEQSPPPVDVLRAVLSALDRDGVCMIRNALPADVPLTIHAQMEPHLAARAESVGLNKQSAGDSGRRSGSVLSRSRASWGAALHPLVLELCVGILGRQVLMKSREEMQSELFFSEPQSTRDSGKNRFRQHPFQLDFTGVVEVAPGGGAEQDLHLDTGKHVFEFRQVLDASITVLWALTPFNAVNGATRVAKGSHRWDLKRAPTSAELTPAAMVSNSCPRCSAAASPPPDCTDFTSCVRSYRSLVRVSSFEEGCSMVLVATIPLRRGQRWCYATL